MFRWIVLFFGYMFFIGLCCGFAFIFIIWFFVNSYTMGRFFGYMFGYQGRNIIYKLGLAYFAIMALICLFSIAGYALLFGVAGVLSKNL